jgi:ABC-type antimicrobial peptide transport system permease subunit
LTSAGSFDVYLSGQQYRDGWSFFFVRTAGAPEAIAEQAKQAMWAIDPGQAVIDVRSMRQRIADTAWQRRLATAFVAAFAGVALVLAAAGVFGVASNLVRQRTREFGVRMALGATPRDILRDVLGQAGRLAAMGIGIGVVVSAGAGLISSRSLTAIQIPLVVGAAGLALVAFAAAFWPAVRAMRCSPVVALRGD